MKTQDSHMTIADYCLALQRKEILVNADYQRSDRVWGDMARSFLIETILLDFPMPKLFLHQRLDLASRATRKDIVDGQQRTRAIHDFYEGRLRLSKSLDTPDVADRTYEELDPGMQAQFLNYSVDFDLFISADDEDIREVFRRMNTFTAPLNPEEIRHARFQGRFKWFIQRAAKRLDTAWVQSGVFSDKQIVRMGDLKLLTELCHALDNGIKTTSRAGLDSIYKKYDKDFAEEEVYEDALAIGVHSLLGRVEIWKSPLVKPYNAYALILAYIHSRTQTKVPGEFEMHDVAGFAPGDEVVNLLILADSLDRELEDVEDDLLPFVKASKDRTNVAGQRKTRFEYFLSALA